MVITIMKTIVHMGFDAEKFWQYASFNADLLQNPEARIPVEELERLMKCAAGFTGDDYFGLHQGAIAEIGDLGILGYVMMHSGTIEGAVAAFQRYNAILCSGFNLDWEVHGEDVLIRLQIQFPGRLSRHCAEDMASTIYRMISRLASRKVPLKEVQFCHEAPLATEPYAAVFGKTPQFGGEQNLLKLDRNILNEKVIYSDARLRTVFESIAEETVNGLAQGSPFSERVAKWMNKCTPTYFPTLQQTAQAFQTSTRSLQLRLKEEETSFQELSVRVRRELAIGYLKKREYSVGEIAYALHFSEPSAFQNAFKKWTGLTPGQYRSKAAEGL